jgi:hypothetical protein
MERVGPRGFGVFALRRRLHRGAVCVLVHERSRSPAEPAGLGSRRSGYVKRVLERLDSGRTIRLCLGWLRAVGRTASRVREGSLGPMSMLVTRAARSPNKALKLTRPGQGRSLAA